MGRGIDCPQKAYQEPQHTITHLENEADICSRLTYASLPLCPRSTFGIKIFHRYGISQQNDLFPPF